VFKEYAEAWRKAQVHRASTTTSVEQQLRLHVYPTIGERRLSSVRPSDIQALVRGLGEVLAPGTVEAVYGRVAAVFNAAVRDRLIPSSPCVEVKRPRPAPSSTLEVLTTDQVLTLADAVPDRYHALIITAAGIGLRPRELFGLTLDRVDFLRRHVRVDRQLVRVRGTGVELGPSRRRRRTEPFRSREPSATRSPRTLRAGQRMTKSASCSPTSATRQSSNTRS